MPFKKISRTPTQTQKRKQRRARREQEKNSIARDLDVAQKLSDQYGLIPTLGTLDTSRGQEVTDLISGRQGMVDKYGQRDPQQEAIRQLMEGGLGGLNAVENTALREGAQSEVDRNFSSQLRALAGYSGQRGLAGLSQVGVNDLSNNRLQAQRDLERDILIKNIDIQDSRRAGYADFLDNLITGEFNRSSTSRADLEKLVGDARNNELNKELFNLGQEKSQTDLRGSTLLGLAGIASNRRNTKKALQLEAQRIRENSGSGSPSYSFGSSLGGGTSDTSAGIG